MALGDCIKVACEIVTLKASEANASKDIATTKADEATQQASIATQEALKAKQEADRAEGLVNAVTVTNGALSPYKSSAGGTTFTVDNQVVLFVWVGGSLVETLPDRTASDFTVSEPVAVGDELVALILN